MQRILRARLQYGELDLTNASIRLVQILPGNDDDPIHISLIHQRLGGEHASLSYEWGPRSPVRTIVVNGQRLPVRQNLWLFLKLARKCRLRKPLWIDAICINQRDPHEKSHQIRMMGEIYSHAEYVIVHLPDLSPAHLAALNTTIRLLYEPDFVPENPLRQFAKAWHSRDQIYYSHNFSGDLTGQAFADVFQSSRIGRWAIKNPEPFVRATRSRAFKEHRDALDQALDILNTANYWKRAWVAQEFILAAKVVLLNTPTFIDLRQAFTLNTTIITPGSAKGDSSFCYTLRSSRQEHGAYSTDERRTGLTVTQCLRLTRQRECSINKDRIYSMLAICPGFSQINVRYDISDEKLLWQIVMLSAKNLLQVADKLTMDYGVLMGVAYKIREIVPNLFCALRLAPPEMLPVYKIQTLLKSDSANPWPWTEAFWISPTVEEKDMAKQLSTASLCVPVRTQRLKLALEFLMRKRKDSDPNEFEWEMTGHFRVWQVSKKDCLDFVGPRFAGRYSYPSITPTTE